MGFVKRHLFFIVLIAVVIAVVGGTAAVTLPRLSDNRKRIEQRGRLSDSLLRFGRPGGGYSPAQVEQIKASVESQREAEAQLTAAVLSANRQGLEPLKITDPRTNEAVPILPIDPEVYDRLNVAWLFPDIYRDAMNRVLARLSATMPPDEEEISSAAKRVENWLRRKQLTDAMERQNETLTLPPGVAPPTGTGEGEGPTGARTIRLGGLFTRYRQPGEGAFRPRSTDPTRPEATVNASEIALDRLNHDRVNDPAHPLYANEASFDMLVLDRSKRTEPNLIWKATVMYWLHQYLVDALLATNHEALAAVHDDMPPNKPKPDLTISTAAVKRLVSVAIGPDASAATANARKLYPYELEPQIGGRRSNYPMGEEGGDGAPPPEANLTRRTGTPDYDVVHLDVEVVANPVELPKLIRNLTNRGFFTVLNVQLSAVDQQVASSTGPTGRMTTSGARGAAGESLFYYGTDPVVRVRLSLEAIFFADWSRPLMPVEMLAKLPAGVLRPADRDRLQAASATAEPLEGTPFGGPSPY